MATDPDEMASGRNQAATAPAAGRGAYACGRFAAQTEAHSSAHKSFMVLETIVSAQRPLSVSELTALMGVPTPTMHRIVRLLDTDGFLQREPGSRLYSPRAAPGRLRPRYHPVVHALGAAPRRT